MKALKSFLLRVAVSLVIVSVPGAVLGQRVQSPNDQSSQTDRQLSQALLSEIRQLRLDIERSSLISYRTQVTIERLRLQHERVDRLTTQIDELRNQVAEMKLSRPHLQEHAQDLETRLSQEQEPQMHGQIDTELRELKYALNQQDDLQSRQQERVIKLTESLQSEQRILEDLSSRLDALDRELEKQLQPGTDTTKRP